jgi:hypothetical protein
MLKTLPTAALPSHCFMSTTEHEPRRPSYRDLLAAYDRARETYERDPSPRSLAVLETGLAILVQKLHRPGTFELGQLVMTPGAEEAMRDARHVPPEFLLRHLHGDWSDLPPEEIQENERTPRVGSRLFSAYRTRTEEPLWVLTEWDRRVTTLLHPQDH